MFGRILSIEIFNKFGESTFLVDPEQENKLQCSGKIDYLPSSSGAPRATIQVYNLPATTSALLFSNRKSIRDEVTGEITEVDDQKLIKISFGYRDVDNGRLSTIFVGSIARAFNTRLDALTTVTKIYAYQLQNLFTSAVSSAQFDAFTSIYDVVKGLFDNSTVQGIEVQIPEIFKSMRIDSPLSFYGKTLDCVSSIVSKKGVNHLVTTTPFGVSIVPMSADANQIEAVALGAYVDNKVVAQSGLIGFPCMDTDGMRFETLINPNITLYSYVWVPNTAIIDNRTGFPGEINSQFGATYDPAGLYRVVKMETQFDSHVGDCKTSYLAVSVGASSSYYL